MISSNFESKPYILTQYQADVKVSNYIAPLNRQREDLTRLMQGNTEAHPLIPPLRQWIPMLDLPQSVNRPTIEFLEGFLLKFITGRKSTLVYWSTRFLLFFSFYEKTVCHCIAWEQLRVNGQASVFSNVTNFENLNLFLCFLGTKLSLCLAI